MEILKTTYKTIATLAILDLAIVTFALAQIAFENRTGDWHPFWRIQAETIVYIASQLQIN